MFYLLPGFGGKKITINFLKLVLILLNYAHFSDTNYDTYIGK